MRIIGDDYDADPRATVAVTWAMTMGMSGVAHSPVPGGRPFREVVPYELAVDTPDRWPLVPDWAVPDRIPFTDLDVPGGRGLYVDTPDRVVLAELPVNNVSIFANRWAWIQRGHAAHVGGPPRGRHGRRAGRRAPGRPGRTPASAARRPAGVRAQGVSVSRVLSVLVLALLLPGCLRVGEEVDMQAIWDLRTTRDIEAVGWPGDMGSAFEATTGQGLEKMEA